MYNSTGVVMHVLVSACLIDIATLRPTRVCWWHPYPLLCVLHLSAVQYSYWGKSEQVIYYIAPSYEKGVGMILMPSSNANPDFTLTFLCIAVSRVFIQVQHNTIRYANHICT